jgi:hypothetical protein
MSQSSDEYIGKFHAAMDALGFKQIMEAEEHPFIQNTTERYCKLLIYGIAQIAQKRSKGEAAAKSIALGGKLVAVTSAWHHPDFSDKTIFIVAHGNDFGNYLAFV